VKAFKANPVVVSAAVVTLIEAILGVLMATEVIAPEVGGPIGTAVAAGFGLVRVLVTPVEKVAKVLDQPLHVVNETLKAVRL